MADKNILKALGALKGKWKDARARANDGGSFENHPDGKYIGRLSTAELGHSEAGRFQVKFEYAITEGELAGQSAYKYMGLDKDESLGWMAKELVRLGVDATELEIEELPKALEGLVKSKPLVRFKLKTKGEYQNLYIEKLIDAEDEDAGADENQDAVEAAGSDEALVDETPGVVEGETEVTFTIKGKAAQSVVLKIDVEKGYLVEADGKKYFKKPEDCTVVVAVVEDEVVEDDEAVVDEEEAEAEEEVAETPAAKPKPSSKPVPAKPKPEPKAEPDEVDLAVGMKVSFKHKGKVVTSTVKKIDEKAGMVFVMVGKEQVKLKPEDMTLIPEGKDS